MKKSMFHNKIPTNDSVIRSALKKELTKIHQDDIELAIIEELGVGHGRARIDIVVVNGIMHGYEIKSDLDTLERLHEQMIEFNNVFDKLTLVVGKRHLYEAINLIPDWWGLIVAKIGADNEVIFHLIREAESNRKQIEISIARLLWREEALQLLEEWNEATGVRSKPRKFIYERLIDTLDSETLKQRVGMQLISRVGWRSDEPLMSNGG